MNCRGLNQYFQILSENIGLNKPERKVSLSLISLEIRLLHIRFTLLEIIVLQKIYVNKLNPNVRLSTMNKKIGK